MKKKKDFFFLNYFFPLKAWIALCTNSTWECCHFGSFPSRKLPAAAQHRNCCFCWPFAHLSHFALQIFVLRRLCSWKGRSRKPSAKPWLFCTITSYLDHQLAAMGYFFLKCSLSGVNLETYDELAFSISLALPVDYCSKGTKSHTAIISCDVQNVIEHSLF